MYYIGVLCAVLVNKLLQESFMYMQTCTKCCCFFLLSQLLVRGFLMNVGIGVSIHSFCVTQKEFTLMKHVSSNVWNTSNFFFWLVVNGQRMIQNFSAKMNFSEAYRHSKSD